MCSVFQDRKVIIKTMKTYMVKFATVGVDLIADNRASKSVCVT